MEKTKLILGALILSILTACGGGGGGGGASALPSSPVTATNTFDLNSLLLSAIKHSYTKTFTVSGTSNGVQVTGSGSETKGAGILQGNFLGIPSIVETDSISGNAIANGISVSLNSTSQNYYDNTYYPIGVNGTVLSVFTTVNQLPMAAKVNDAGTWKVSNNYPSGTTNLQVFYGHTTYTWTLTADTATTALWTITATKRDLSGTVQSTSNDVYRISQTTITPISSNSSVGNQSLTITYN